MGSNKVVGQSLALMEHLFNQSLVVHYLLQLGKTITIGCFLLLWKLWRVKIDSIGLGFWRYYFKICPFQMDLVDHSFLINKRYTFM